MSALPDNRVLTGVRLSEMARCPRMAAYRGLHTEAEPFTDEQNRYLSRGQLFGVYAYEQYAAKYGRGQVEREREIEWPHGVGHADIYIRPEKLIVEAFSTVTPKGASVQAKIEQAKQYVYYDPQATRGAVHVINPNDLARERTLPVIVTKADRARIDDNTMAVGQALLGGDLPPRVCEKPGDAYGRFCPFAETCFDGWQEPDPIVLDGQHAELAARLFDVEQRVKQSEQKLKVEKQARATLRELVAPLAPAGVECRAGQVTVKRIAVRGRTTFDTPAMIAAGVVTSEAAEPFKTVGSGSDRWSVTRDEEIRAEDIDYGEVPF